MKTTKITILRSCRRSAGVIRKRRCAGRSSSWSGCRLRPSVWGRQVLRDQSLPESQGRRGEFATSDGRSAGGTTGPPIRRRGRRSPRVGPELVRRAPALRGLQAMRGAPRGAFPGWPSRGPIGARRWPPSSEPGSSDPGAYLSNFSKNSQPTIPSRNCPSPTSAKLMRIQLGKGTAERPTKRKPAAVMNGNLLVRGSLRAAPAGPELLNGLPAPLVRSPAEPAPWRGLSVA